MRTPAQWNALENQINADRAVSAVLSDAPTVALARSGALVHAATSGKNSDAPLDADGDPLAFDGFFRAGDIPGVKVVRP
jgi:hypothetical protein